jgi:hypothetical protein
MGAADEFNALLYGETHPSTLNYLRSQFDNLSNTLTEPAKQFMEKGRELYEYFHNSDAMRFARDVVNRVMGTTEIRIDNIRELSVLCDFQDAGLVMQRWLMANPTTREMYHNQRIDGYSTSYVDMSPGDIGENHYDYRRVMDCMVQVSEDDYKIVQYMDQLKEGDRDLLLYEKTDILSGWTQLEYLLALCRDDPTHSDGGMM